MTALLVVIAAALALAGVAAGATGTGTASTLMGSASINVATGTTLSVAAHPVVFMPGWSQQTAWDTAYQSSERQWPGASLDVYTVACWEVWVSGINPMLSGGALASKCGGAYDSGPASSLSNALAQTATGTLGTGGLQMCSWLAPYNVTDNNCNPTPGTQYVDGVASPAVSGDMVPNLDAFVGQVVTFEMLTNWCSYIAPVGYDVLHHLGYGTGPSVSVLGCANQEYAVPLGAAARTLAATGNPLKARVKVKVKASAFDCHVPRVKGLTLKRARARLHRAHCSAGHVSYVRRGKSGTVRSQPFKAGTGRPRGFKVSLAVTR